MDFTQEKSGDCTPASNICLFIPDTLKYSTPAYREQYFYRLYRRAWSSFQVDPCTETRAAMIHARDVWYDNYLTFPSQNGGAHD